MRHHQALFGILSGVLIGVVLLGLPTFHTVHAQTDDQPCGDTVIVEEGDTLLGIAERCNTTVEEIQRANPGIDPRVLAIGSELIIPQPSETVPRVAVMPAVGPAGTQVRVIANDFSPSTDITIGVGRPGAEWEPVATLTTAIGGNVRTDITIPESVGNDEWVVVVTAQGGAQTAISSNTVPNVTIAPTRGIPGTNVEFIANGFPANTEVGIGVGRWRSEYNVIATAQTDANGAINGTVTIPADSAFDDRWVVVIQGPETSATSAIFYIPQTADATPMPAQPTPVPATPIPATPVPATPVPGDGQMTYSTMTLIAIEDGGRSGMLVGCNDSAVPITIQVPTSPDPITATLQTLLGVAETTYRQSGLYNALAQSDLMLDSVQVINGEAHVMLIGTVNQSRVCDAPRIDAQLRQTVLQFANVDRVILYLNGEPLDL